MQLDALDSIADLGSASARDLEPYQGWSIKSTRRVLRELRQLGLIHNVGQAPGSGAPIVWGATVEGLAALAGLEAVESVLGMRPPMRYGVRS